MSDAREQGTHPIIKHEETCDSVEFQKLENVDRYHWQTHYSYTNFSGVSTLIFFYALAVLNVAELVV